MHRTASTEYAPCYGKYLALVPEDDLLLALETRLADTLARLGTVRENQGNVRRPPYIWSIKEVVRHLTDSESS
jgi:hypothetical protein